MYTLILIGMLFCHIIDDFYLQGILAKMKQRIWWDQNYPNKLYENDYKMALALHSLSWCCCIHIPIVMHIAYCDWYFNEYVFIIVFIINWLVHVVVDDLKANKLKINLVTDQLIHIVQIIITWALYMYALI